MKFCAAGMTIALVAGAMVLSAPTGARAAPHDGDWSVVIVTESGNCDVYRYPVTIANGRINYAGNMNIDVTGTVSSAGAVKVDVRSGERGASGTGRMSGQAGSGTWKGAAANASCMGRWEAERR